MRSMFDDVPALMTANPAWGLVLAAYRTLEDELPPAPKAKKDAAPSEPVAALAVVVSEPAGEQSAPAFEEAGDETESLVGWFDRIREVAGVDAAILSQVHGRLIAHGLLKCEIGQRSSGLVYKISTAGKTALKTALAIQAQPLAESA
ncbi:hypothetical protein VT03_01670 [Planctomyces sp. SH-PL14]|nr:hypothetical protein VT03_01670 [Planctomyces sp. SH-PL14]